MYPIKLILWPCLLAFASYAQVTVSTLAGSGSSGFANGTGSIAQFDTPNQLAVDSLGNVYVADFGNERIRKIDSNGNVTTFAGTGLTGFLNGSASSARFDGPLGIVVAPNGDVFTAETSNRIRKIASGSVSSFAGSGTAGSSNGTGTSASFNVPTYLAMDSQGNLYVADRFNNKIRKISPSGVVSNFAGSGILGFQNGASNVASFNKPYGIAVGPGDTVYVADRENHAIRKIDPMGNVTTLAGMGSAGFVEGLGSVARFNIPADIVVGWNGVVYVADRLNHRIRQITPSGMVSTLAGTGSAGFSNGPSNSATFDLPTGIALSTDGAALFVSEVGNDAIRKIDLNINNYCDTLIQIVHDTIWMTDTIWKSRIDTIYIQDTIYMTDTVYISSIEEGRFEMGVKLYPNPVSDVINLSYELNTSAEVELRLLDASGRVIKEWPLVYQAPGSHNQRLYVGNLEMANQAMFLHVKMNDKVNVYRVLLAE